MAAYCTLASDPVKRNVSRHQSLFVELMCFALDSESQVCNIMVDDCPIKALLYSRSLVNLVDASLIVWDYIPVKCMCVICHHGDTKVYAIAFVKVKTVLGTVSYEVAVLKNLMQNVILGLNFPSFWELWEIRKLLKRSDETPGDNTLHMRNDTNGVLTDMHNDTYNFPLQVLAGDMNSPPAVPFLGLQACETLLS